MWDTLKFTSIHAYMGLWLFWANNLATLVNFIEFLAHLGPPRDPKGNAKVGKLTKMVSGQHSGTILVKSPQTEIFFKKILIPRLWK